MKVRARPEITLADASRCDVSRCKFVQPSLPVDGVVSETGEGDMFMGKIALRMPAINSMFAVCRYSILPAIVLADRSHSQKSIPPCKELSMTERPVSL